MFSLFNKIQKRDSNQQNFRPIIDILLNEIEIEQNDYQITNVFVAVGFDVLCYEPSFDKAIEVYISKFLCLYFFKLLPFSDRSSILG